MMKSIEIGSEFWTSEKGIVFSNNRKTYLSGRTALTAILIDLRHRGAKSICLPEYCCESMIEPFFRQSMKISFYPVRKTKNGMELSIEGNIDGDAVLLVDYFGYMTGEIRELIHYIRSTGKITILDLTHSILTEESAFEADYFFGSYRKWTGIEAGFASGYHVHRLVSWELNDTGSTYLSMRAQARSVKSEFVAGGYCNEGLRKNQLRLFEQAEEFLDHEYLSDTDEENKSLMMALDNECIRDIRRENANAIYSYFSQLTMCKPMFSRLPKASIPLAVPVMVTEGKRDSLRTFLQKNGVFSPIHWPISLLHKAGEDSLKLYRNELSLVCDQRYDILDMMRMMEMVKQWEKNTST